MVMFIIYSSAALEKVVPMNLNNFFDVSTGFEARSSYINVCILPGYSLAIDFSSRILSSTLEHTFSVHPNCPPYFCLHIPNRDCDVSVARGSRTRWIIFSPGISSNIWRTAAREILITLIILIGELSQDNFSFEAHVDNG